MNNSIILASVLALAAGCSSTDKPEVKEASLDAVQLDKSPATLPKKAAITPTGDVKSEDVIKWQGVFKKEPTPAIKNRLIQRLKRWDSSGTVEDLLKKGRAEVAMGRYTSGYATLHKALRKEPTNVSTLLELASVSLRMRKISETAEYLASAKQEINISNTINPKALLKHNYLFALQGLASGAKKSGRATLSAMIANDQSFIPAYIALASSYIKEGKHNAAEFVVRRGRSKSPDTPALLNIEGIIAESKGDNSEAIEWYKKAITQDKNFYPAQTNIANIYIKEGDLKQAEKILNEVINKAPNNLEANLALGVVHLKRKKYQEAQGFFSFVLERQPENPHARINLGITLARGMGRTIEAVRLFKEVQTITKKRTKLHNFAGELIAAYDRN